MLCTAFFHLSVIDLSKRKSVKTRELHVFMTQKAGDLVEFHDFFLYLWFRELRE